MEFPIMNRGRGWNVTDFENICTKDFKKNQKKPEKPCDCVTDFIQEFESRWMLAELVWYLKTIIVFFWKL